MCDDCQCFARFLGNPQRILDANNGTALFQLTPNRVKITSGTENLACMRLGPKGLTRWYAKCCNTPMANTLSLKMSFVGLCQNFIDFAGSSKEELLGPVQSRVMAKFGKGAVPKPCHQKYPIGITLKLMKMILLGKVTKTYLPNPFFDEKTGAPISPPKVLSLEERNRLILTLDKRD